MTASAGLLQAYNCKGSSLMSTVHGHFGLTWSCQNGARLQSESERFLGVVGQKPSVSKTNRLHICCDLLVFIYYFEVYSIDSTKMWGNFPEVFNRFSLRPVHV